MTFQHVIDFVKQHGGTKVLHGATEQEIAFSLKFFADKQGLYLVTKEDKILGLICAYIDSDNKEIRLYNLVVAPSISGRLVLVTAYNQFVKRNPEIATMFEAGIYKFKGERSGKWKEFPIELIKRYQADEYRRTN